VGGRGRGRGRGGDGGGGGNGSGAVAAGGSLPPSTYPQIQRTKGRKPDPPTMGRMPNETPKQYATSLIHQPAIGMSFLGAAAILPRFPQNGVAEMDEFAATNVTIHQWKTSVVPSSTLNTFA
jgi:hypothetical protein